MAVGDEWTLNRPNLRFLMGNILEEGSDGTLKVLTFETTTERKLKYRYVRLGILLSRIQFPSISKSLSKYLNPL